MNHLDSLTELEQDAITEVFNIGICKAAASLSEMVSREVSLSVPELTITTLDQANKSIQTSRENVTGVKECFDGAIAGNAILLLPQNRSLDLIRLLFPSNMPDEMIQEMEDETLAEIGNIILNACLSSLSDIIGEELDNQIPQVFRNSLGEIILCDTTKVDLDQYILRMDMNLTVEELDITGDISFLIIIKSIDQFKEKLASYFGLPLD